MVPQASSHQAGGQWGTIHAWKPGGGAVVARTQDPASTWMVLSSASRGLGCMAGRGPMQRKGVKRLAHHLVSGTPKCPAGSRQCHVPPSRWAWQADGGGAHSLSRKQSWVVVPLDAALREVSESHHPTRLGQGPDESCFLPEVPGLPSRKQDTGWAPRGTPTQERLTPCKQVPPPKALLERKPPTTYASVGHRNRTAGSA